MRLPRARFKVRRLMAAVAVAAVVCVVASNAYRHGGITDRLVVLTVASAVAAGSGLWAMRRPLPALLPLIAAWIATPGGSPHPRRHQRLGRRLLPGLDRRGPGRLALQAPFKPGRPP